MFLLQLFAIQVLDIRDLVNYPFKALNSFSSDPFTLKLLSSIPVIAFLALLLTAIWIQAKKYPVRVIGDTKNDNIRNF
tara:strand:+ start:526 stop:759 length:234 start_codon:yes stop_codon:yes gene_type:complete